MPQAFCQQWEESESGWGVRPDGYSLHLSASDAKDYAKDTLKRQHEYFVKGGMKDSAVPAEYSRPCGEPYLCEVTEEVYETVKASKFKGVTFNSNNYPDPIGPAPGTWQSLS